MGRYSACDSPYTLKVEAVDAPADSGGLLIGSSKASTASAVAPEGQTRCPTCDGFIPNATFKLHESQCQRRNWKCPECNTVSTSRTG